MNRIFAEGKEDVLGKLSDAAYSVASFALLAAFAALVVKQLPDPGARDQLVSDVRAVNAAIAEYRAFGGSLDDLKTPEEVLSLLDLNGGIITQAVEEDSAVDVRLSAEMQSIADAASHEPRAVWNPCVQRFVVMEGNFRGVRRFVHTDLTTDLDAMPARIAARLNFNHTATNGVPAERPDLKTPSENDGRLSRDNDELKCEIVSGVHGFRSGTSEDISPIAAH